MIHSCKEDLAREFEMKDVALLHYFLGLEICHWDGEILCLKESTLYWVSFTWRATNPWILLFQEIGGKRMLLLER